MSIEYQHIIQRFSKPTVLVLGDLILDVYLKGTTTRLSPEAPVPIVDVQGTERFIGGAANVAANVRSLGADVIFCSVTGKDEEGDKAIRALDEMGIRTKFVLRDPSRETIVKTRVMAQSQVLVRFDHGTEEHIDHHTEQKLIAQISAIYPKCDAVIIADYNKGVLTPNIIKALKRLQRQHPVFLAVDSKRLPAFKELEAGVVKPNYEEAVKLLGIQQQHTGRAEQLQRCAKDICRKTGAKTTVITLDADGAVVFEKDRAVYRAHAHPVTNPSVIGAGDTFISAFTLALVSEADIPSATELAAAAAAIAVGKEDTACCTGVELHSFFAHQYKYVQDLHDLKRICEIYKAQNRRIVFTNGCFDILHSGHVNYLNRARKLGDVLIVGINNDASIQRLKGKSRPINPLKDRVEVMAALSAVDHIISFGAEEDDTPVELIRIVRPAVFVKGGDYTKDRLPEAAVIEELGGEILFLPHIPDHSTTSVIRRIHEISTLSQIAPAS